MKIRVHVLNPGKFVVGGTELDYNMFKDFLETMIFRGLVKEIVIKTENSSEVVDTLKEFKVIS